MILIHKETGEVWEVVLFKKGKLILEQAGKRLEVEGCLSFITGRFKVLGWL